jgi:predicted nucleotidyltransferase
MQVKQMPELTLDHLRQHRDQILALADRHGARNVRVFGSVARGDAVAGSDLDLLVDFEPGRSLMDHGELIMDLEAVLGCRVDVVSARGLRDRFRTRVLADAVVL